MSSRTDRSIAVEVQGTVSKDEADGRPKRRREAFERQRSDGMA